MPLIKGRVTVLDPVTSGVYGLAKTMEQKKGVLASDKSFLVSSGGSQVIEERVR